MTDPRRLTAEEHAVLRRTQERMSKPERGPADAKLTAEEREVLTAKLDAVFALVESILAKRAQPGEPNRDGQPNVNAGESPDYVSPPAAPVRSMKEFRERYGESATPDCPACGGTGKVPSEWAQSGASETLTASPVGDATRLPVPAAPSPDAAALREFVGRYVAAMLACAGMRRASDRDAKRQLDLKADAAGRVLDSALVALEARPEYDEAVARALFRRRCPAGEWTPGAPNTEQVLEDVREVRAAERAQEKTE